jgi:hypothetical protein
VAAIGALLVLLAAPAAPTPAGSVVVDRIAASVNDTAIPESALRKAMLLSPLRREPGESSDAFRGRVLEALIDQQLEYDDALRFGPEPPDAADVEAATAKITADLRAEGKDPQAEFERAGMTPEDVRASVERQLVVSRYLRERFRPMTFADEEAARAEYDERYVAERRAAGEAPAPFEQVAAEMRARAQQRAFEAEAEKWIRELREKARIVVHPTASETPTLGATVPLGAAPSAASAPTPAPTPAAAPTPAPTPRTSASETHGAARRRR